MIIRVINALEACERIDSYVLCGPSQSAVDGCPRLQQFIKQNNVTWTSGEKSLSNSIRAGLEKIDPDSLVLITTADHALLDVDALDCFLDRVDESRVDFNIGLVNYSLVKETYPGAQRTVLRFSDGEFCSCNLYAVSTRRGRGIISFWRRVEANRKKPWQIVVRLFGFSALVKYFFGLLSIDQARRSVFKNTEVRVNFVELPFARASIDVDTPADKELVERILSGVEGQWPEDQGVHHD